MDLYRQIIMLLESIMHQVPKIVKETLLQALNIKEVRVKHQISNQEFHQQIELATQVKKVMKTILNQLTQWLQTNQKVSRRENARNQMNSLRIKIKFLRVLNSQLIRDQNQIWIKSLKNKLLQKKPLNKTTLHLEWDKITSKANLKLEIHRTHQELIHLQSSHQGVQKIKLTLEIKPRLLKTLNQPRKPSQLILLILHPYPIILVIQSKCIPMQ